QVEPFLPGDREGLRRRHDAELLAGVVDHPDFADADAFVDPHAIVTAGTAGKSDKASYVKAASLPFVAISSCAWAMKSATLADPLSPPARSRTAMVPSAASWSPITRISGFFWSWASRI